MMELRREIMQRGGCEESCLDPTDCDCEWAVALVHRKVKEERERSAGQYRLAIGLALDLLKHGPSSVRLLPMCQAAEKILRDVLLAEREGGTR